MQKISRLIFAVQEFFDLETKNKFCQKKILFALLCGILFPTSLFSNPPYHDAFDESIYDQSRLIQALQQGAKPRTLDSLSKEDYRNLILNELYSRKIQCLEEKVFGTCDRQLKDLEILMAQHEFSTGTKILKVVGDFLSALGGIVLPGFLPGVGEKAIPSRILLGGMAVCAGATMQGLHEFFRPDGQPDLARMQQELERGKKELIINITQEPISDLEVSYVLQKRFYSTEFQTNIEKALLMARRDDGYPGFPFIRSFLEGCLNIPLHKKEINPNQPCWNLTRQGSFQELLTAEQQEARQKLMRYSPRTKDDIQRIITQITHSSKSQDKSYRRFYFFAGGPGAGKSEAAQSIPLFLGLPYFEITIQAAGDISQASLKGVNWKNKIGAMGHLACALTKGIKIGEDEKEDLEIPVPVAEKYTAEPTLRTRVLTKKATVTYKNSILILNDLHLLLADDRTSTEILAFLLAYLDPEKDSVFNCYFDAPVDTSGLTIFITGNEPIPQGEQFDALRDRCVEVAFQPLEVDQKIEFLTDFFDDLQRRFALPSDLPPDILPIPHIFPPALLTFKGQVLMSMQDIDSMRSARIYMEGKILDKKNRLSNEIPLGGDEERKEEGERQEGRERENSVLPLMLPVQSAFPQRLNQKLVSKLDQLLETACGLESPRQITQYEAMKELLGYRRSYLGNLEDDYYGHLRSLWSSTRGTLTGSYGYSGEAANNLKALANRMWRFEDPQRKNEVFRFHLRLVQAIVDRLLTVDSWIYEQITSSDAQKHNIHMLATHLEALYALKDRPCCEGESLSPESQVLVNAYAAWYGTNPNKTMALCTKYPTVSLVQRVNPAERERIGDNAFSEIFAGEYSRGRFPL